MASEVVSGAREGGRGARSPLRRAAWRAAAVCMAAVVAGCPGATCPGATCPDGASALAKPALPFVVVTFNTGTTQGLGHDAPPDDGYTSAMAELSDTHYGDGLAWQPAVDATRAWFAARAAAGAPVDLVGFQEIFHSPDCAEVPAEARAGFVCASWSAGDPSVANAVLGAGYQVVCHPGKDDKCVGVRRAWGQVRGCAQDHCLSAGVGHPVAGCGSGSRVARFVIDRVVGPPLTVVHVHGSSGLKADDQACRQAQFLGIVEAMADGAPGLNGAAHVVLGDFNTDPHRFLSVDRSAQTLASFAAASPEDAAASGRPLHFVTDLGDEVTPTYGGVVNIDHVLSDRYDGPCRTAGIAPDLPSVTSATYFDHKPVVCVLSRP